MIHKASGVEDESNSHRTSTAIASAVLAVGIAAAGCSEEADGKRVEMLDTKAGVCAEPAPGSSPESMITMAPACKLVTEGGKIALIGFGVDQNRLIVLAGAAKRLITRTYQGRVIVDVAPMVATPQAAELHASRASSPDCTDDIIPPAVTTPSPDDNTLEAARASDEAMDLNEYDLVIAATAQPACSGALGRGEVPGRYSEVYSVTDNDSGAEVGIAHEVGHNLGFEHVSDVVYVGPDTGGPLGEGPLVDYNFWDLAAERPPFDLDAYLASCQIQEYAASHGQSEERKSGKADDFAQEFTENVMGGNSIGGNPTMNPVQLDVLRKQGDSTTRERAIAKEWVTFRQNDSEAGYYGTITLDRPVAVKVVVDDQEAVQLYDRLVFLAEPTTHAEGAPDAYQHKQRMYLLQSRTTGMAHLGGMLVPLAGSDQVDLGWSYTVGGKRVDVKMDGYSVRIRATSVG